MNDFEDIINGSDLNKEKTNLDVLKELFSLKDIESKTDLTTKMIISLNKKRALAKLLDWEDLDMVLNDTLLLLISKDRKGRGEFVEGFKAERQKENLEETKGNGFNFFKR